METAEFIFSNFGITLAIVAILIHITIQIFKTNNQNEKNNIKKA
jgi:hypothetical protein